LSDPAEIFNKIPDFAFKEEMKPVSSEAFNNIVHNRRSVRVYTEDKVPEQVVRQVLEWALLAPNSSNLQCWEFYWVRSPEKKEKLIKALLNQPAARTSQELIVAVARLDTWKRTRKQMIELFNQKDNVPTSAKAYYEKLVPVVYNQGPLGIYGLLKKIITPAIGLFRPIPRGPQSRSDMRVWAVKSTALACQNIMMGFSAHGFDTCPLEGFDAVRVKEILELGRNAETVMAISVGKRSEKGVYGPRVRMPTDQFIKEI
jgi:nitroreductase